jgi:hypothetical protein
LMAKRRSTSAKSDAPGLLERLSADEAAAVLHQLLDEHPELRSEAEQFATKLVSSPSIEDIAQDVCDRIMGIDLDVLNERAGSHSWGYVEPSEAAIELLEEALDDLVEDMKRKVELGLGAAAETACAGIVAGLYEARPAQSDGALGWAQDFPGEEADYIVGEFLRACPQSVRNAAQKSLMETLAKRAPTWAEDLKRATDRAVKE